VDAITNANAEFDMMRANAKAAVGSTASASLVGGTTGALSLDSLTGSSISKAKEQYRHFKGWAYVAVRAIAQRIAGQDLFVGRVRSSPTGGRKLILPKSLKSIGDRIEPIESHPLLDAVDQPNPIMVRWSLLYSTVSSLKLTGRAFWWITDGEDGKLNIWPIPSDWIEPGDPMRATRLVRPYGGVDQIELPGEDVAHFCLPDPSNPFGSMSPLQSQSAAIATDEAIQTAQHRSFQNGVFPGLLIKVGRLPGMMPGQPGERPVLEPEQRQELVDAVRKLYGGALRNNSRLIVDGMIEGVEKITNMPSEMDFLDSGKQTKARILQAFGVNPIIVGDVADATRAQAIVAEKSFCQNTCNPIIELLSQVLTRWVGQRFSGENLVAWLAPCRADDPEQTLAEWEAALKVGAVDLSEFRSHVLNLPHSKKFDVALSPATPSVS